MDFLLKALANLLANFLRASIDFVLDEVLLSMTVLITIVLAIGRGIQWQTAEEQEKPMRKKALFNTIGIGVLIAMIAGLVEDAGWIFY